MPKVKGYIKPNPKAFVQVSALIKFQLEYLDISVEELSKQTLIPLSTLYSRIQNPEDLRLKELVRISKVLGLSEIELMQGIANNK